MRNQVLLTVIIMNPEQPRRPLSSMIQKTKEGRVVCLTRTIYIYIYYNIIYIFLMMS